MYSRPSAFTGTSQEFLLPTICPPALRLDGSHDSRVKVNCQIPGLSSSSFGRRTYAFANFARDALMIQTRMSCVARGKRSSLYQQHLPTRSRRYAIANHDFRSATQHSGAIQLLQHDLKVPLAPPSSTSITNYATPNPSRPSKSPHYHTNTASSSSDSAARPPDATDATT